MTRRRKLSLAILLFLLLFPLASCSPWYVIRAAYEESKILLKREKIEQVIADPATTDAERAKLALVLEARDFAMKIGLDPGESFTRYSRVGRDVLAWVLVASKDDSFTLKQWWFPIVGSVPYKGYFELEDAKAQATELEKDGYETWVRGTEAFSTLGWFNDPILSTTLKNDDVRIVSTVIHESLHSTLWVPNHVDFNESLANFVGLQGTIDFYEEKLAACGEDSACVDAASAGLALAGSTKAAELRLASVIDELYHDLNDLYASSRSREEKLAERVAIFERYVGPVRAQHPGMKIMKAINNAEIIQLKLYLTSLTEFDRLYTARGRDRRAFLDDMRAVKEKAEAGQPPFEALEALLERLGETA